MVAPRRRRCRSPAPSTISIKLLPVSQGCFLSVVLWFGRSIAPRFVSENPVRFTNPRPPSTLPGCLNRAPRVSYIFRCARQNVNGGRNYRRGRPRSCRCARAKAKSVATSASVISSAAEMAAGNGGGADCRSTAPDRGFSPEPVPGSCSSWRLSCGTKHGLRGSHRVVGESSGRRTTRFFNGRQHQFTVVPPRHSSSSSPKSKVTGRSDTILVTLPFASHLKDAGVGFGCTRQYRYAINSRRRPQAVDGWRRLAFTVRVIG